MKRSERDEWVAALRSDQFEQAVGYLKILVNDEPERFGYCCLGVKCELDVRAGNRHGIVSELPRCLPSVRFAVKPEPSPNDDGSTWSPSWNDEMPTDAIRQAWGLSDAMATTLAGMNDGDSNYHRHTFREIADWIEENVPVEEDDASDGDVTNTGDVDNPL